MGLSSVELVCEMRVRLGDLGIKPPIFALLVVYLCSHIIQHLLSCSSLLSSRINGFPCFYGALGLIYSRLLLIGEDEVIFLIMLGHAASNPLII
jgi:hypothetical protein